MVIISNKEKISTVDAINQDNTEVGRLMARHLLDLGHRDVAFITPPLTRRQWQRSKRVDGFVREFEKAGLSGHVIIRAADESVDRRNPKTDSEYSMGYALTRSLLADIVRVGIAGINDPLGCHGAYHAQILLFQPGITLGIADENSVATLVGYRLDSLKEHHIVRAGNSWAKDNNHFFLFVLFFIFVARKLIAQFSGRAFHFFHCFSGKRNIVLMVQNHGNRCLGNSRFLCHI